MIRKIISMARRLIIGPSLHQLTKLKHSEISNLMLLSSEDPVLSLINQGQKQTQQIAATQATTGEIAQLSSDLANLKHKIGMLTEQVEVLERILKDNSRLNLR